MAERPKVVPQPAAEPTHEVRSTQLSRFLLVVFLFVTFVFGVLSYRSEQADRRITANQHRIEQVVHAREITLARRAVIDQRFCDSTQTAFNAIREVIATGLQRLEATHPTDPAARALRAQQIQTSKDLLLKLGPISCPGDVQP